MSDQNVVREAVGELRIAHCCYPAWEAGEISSISNASSIAVSFTRQRRAAVQIEDLVSNRNIPAGSFGAAGATPIHWLRVREPSECLEVTASDSLRIRLARELNVIRHADLDDLHGESDPIIWTLAARLRAMVRSRNGDTLGIHALGVQLYRRLFELKFGGRESVTRRGRLSAARLALVLEWIDAHALAPITIGQLADVASLTTSHFIRSFKRSVGISPYQYVRTRRLERAREMLEHGASVHRSAELAGFLSASQFSQAFSHQYGFSPTQTPIRGKRKWLSRGAS